jgi:DNA polymerase-3 subunit epsilon/ATP-dependent DNA helicase DinG
MNQIYISLDLETTGLDPEQDEITEIGAVKFRGHQVLETFQTLVNPFRPIPYRIHLLTGISDDELKGAPSLSAVAHELTSFIGKEAILGQNISFDINFLKAKGIGLTNPTYDIWELARILLPQATDYQLPTLARELNISSPIQHRALADAITAKEVFLALSERISQLSLPIITEVNRLTRTTDWSWRHLFLEAENEKIKEVSLWDMPSLENLFHSSSIENPANQVISSPKVDLKQLSVEKLANFLAPEGVLAKKLADFEFRPGQVKMLEAVAQALNENQQLIVEAGTGIGKSLAYLLPSIFFSLNNNTPLVISTYTINLQEQLMTKDIPSLLDDLGDWSTYLRATQLKGRYNYLCLRQWEIMRKSPGLSLEEVKFLLRLLVWLSGTSSGDRAEINLLNSELPLWNRVCASEENCLGESCPEQSLCFLYRARQRTNQAHLVVVNHALLLADLTTGNRILPDYRRVIIDEAHHLEDEATRQFGYQIGLADFLGYFDRLSGRGGILHRLRNYLRGVAQKPMQQREIWRRIDNLEERTDSARGYLNRFFDTLSYFLSSELAEAERETRLTPEIRRQPKWREVAISWENLSLRLKEIENGLVEIGDSFKVWDGAHLTELVAELPLVQRRGEWLRSKLNSIITSPEAQNIYWISLESDSSLFLHVAPLYINEILQRELFSQKESVVLTSATLTTEGSFEYTKRQLGLRGSEELQIPAPFDYPTKALIYLPQDVPEPDQAGYLPTVAELLIELCRATQGRTLVLFTSHSSLQATYAAIEKPLEEEGISVLGQGVSGSPKRLLNSFKANSRAVLLGAASFWEGIDVVGKVLSVLVMPRLPFSVPNEPVSQARSELFSDPFNQYTLPQAILKFKQGFGRLIRSKQDRGVMVVLDRRLQTRPYGKAFLRSLPPCTIKVGPRRELAREALKWLGK